MTISWTWFIGPDSGWFWSMLQAIIVAVSLWYIYKQIRIQSNANMLHACFEMANKWDSPRMAEARRRTCSSDGDQTAEALQPCEERVASFFEELAVFLDKNAFTKDVIWETYSYYIEHYWPMLRKKIKSFRQEQRDGTWFTNFEALHSTMSSMSRQNGVHGFDRSGDDIEKFKKQELAAARRLIE